MFKKVLMVALLVGVLAAVLVTPVSAAGSWRQVDDYVVAYGPETGILYTNVSNVASSGWLKEYYVQGWDTVAENWVTLKTDTGCPVAFIATGASRMFSSDDSGTWGRVRVIVYLSGSQCAKTSTMSHVGGGGPYFGINNVTTCR